MQILKFIKPYKTDGLFMVFWFLVLILPLAFFFQTFEKFETLKWCLWFLSLGLGMWYWVGKTSLQIKINKFLFFYLGFFLLLGLISVLLAPQFSTAIVGTYSRFTNGWLFYALWVLSFLGLFAVFTPEKNLLLLKTAFWTGVPIAVLGLVQSMFGWAFYEGLDRSVFARAPSFLGNPNFTTMYLACLVPLGLYFFSETKSFTVKIFVALAGFLFLFAILALASRGAWLALITGGGFLLLGLLIFKFTWKVKVSVFSCMLLVCGLFFVFGSLARPGATESALKLHDINVSSRLLAWSMAGEAVVKNPVFGVGLGNFHIYFERHRNNTLSDHNGVYDDVHNLFLQQASTAGLPFTLMFWGLIGYAGIKLLKKLWQVPNVYHLSLLGSLLVWVIASSFNPVSLPNFLLLIILLLPALNFPSSLEIKVPRHKQGDIDLQVHYYLSRGKLRGIQTCISSSARKLNSKLFNFSRSTSQIKVERTFLKPMFMVFGTAMIAYSLAFFSSEVLFFKGLKAFNQQSYVEASKDFSLANKLNPFNRLLKNYTAGTAIILNPQDPLIVKKITDVVSWEAFDANSYAGQAKLYFLWYLATQDQTHLQACIEAMQTALELDPYYPQRYFRLGYYLAESGKLAEARETVKLGLQLYNKDVAGWTLLAKIYQLEKKPEQTAFAIDKAYKLEPLWPELRLLQRAIKTNLKNYLQLPIPASINTLDFL